MFVLGSAKLGWDPAATLAPLGAKVTVTADVDGLLERLLGELAAGDHVVLMSNGSFDGLPQSSKEPSRPAPAACVEHDDAGALVSTIEIPLFPLKTVVFPGGPLALRIFEPRYLDMVARCLRGTNRFGVVAIRQGSEVGAAETFDVGTLAEIVDWHQETGGLLGIPAVGRECFRLARSTRQPDGLYVGEGSLLPPEPRSRCLSARRARRVVAEATHAAVELSAGRDRVRRRGLGRTAARGSAAARAAREAGAARAAPIRFCGSIASPRACRRGKPRSEGVARVVRHATLWRAIGRRTERLRGAW